MWKIGKINWFSPEFKEGMLTDIEDNESYYLNDSAVDQLLAINLNTPIVSGDFFKFKINNAIRSTKACEIEEL